MRGTVIRRGQSWSVVLDLGRDDRGKRIRKWHSGFTSKKEAERARVELLSDLDHGTYAAPNRITLGDYLADEWLPGKRATVKATTWASYRTHVTKHIKPRIGGVSLAVLAPGHLNAFYGDLLVDGRRNGPGGLAPATVRRIHATLHKALGDAVRWGRLPRNPADLSDPPREERPELSIWTPDQLRTFLEAVADDRYYAAWLLAATTGMRRGEILGLRWSDLDLDAGHATIRQIRTVADYQVVTQTPKTDSGARTIALDADTIQELRRHRDDQSAERQLFGSDYRNHEDLLFVAHDGMPIHPERLSSWFKRHCRRSELPPIRLHDIRHSYVTALLNAGVPLKVVSQRVGHSSPMVTMSIYQHVIRGDDEAAAEIGARAILGDH